MNMIEEDVYTNYNAVQRFLIKVRQAYREFKSELTPEQFDQAVYMAQDALSLFSPWMTAEPPTISEDNEQINTLREVTAWQPIETAPKDDTMILAATSDGRVMVWAGYILHRTRNGPQPIPAHLQFPATHWMPLPSAPEVS